MFKPLLISTLLFALSSLSHAIPLGGTVSNPKLDQTFYPPVVDQFEPKAPLMLEALDTNQVILAGNLNFITATFSFKTQDSVNSAVIEQSVNGGAWTSNPIMLNQWILATAPDNWAAQPVFNGTAPNVTWKIQTSATANAENCYRVRVSNTNGTSYSNKACIKAWGWERKMIKRLQVRVMVDSKSGAGTDDLVAVRLNDYLPKPLVFPNNHVAYLYEDRDNFHAGDDHTYEVLPCGGNQGISKCLRDVDDITRISLGKTGNDNACISGVQLLVNETVAATQTFSPCQVLTTEAPISIPVFGPRPNGWSSISSDANVISFKAIDAKLTAILGDALVAVPTSHDIWWNQDDYGPGNSLVVNTVTSDPHLLKVTGRIGASIDNFFDDMFSLNFYLQLKTERSTHWQVLISSKNCSVSGDDYGNYDPLMCPMVENKVTKIELPAIFDGCSAIDAIFDGLQSQIGLNINC